MQVCNILNSPPEQQWDNLFSVQVRISHLSYLRSHTMHEAVGSVVLYDMNQTSEPQRWQREVLQKV